MTDTMMGGGGGRGGVGIRLFVQGGEVVKRTFDQVGDSGKRMWAEIAMGERSANPALRGLSRASNEAQGSVEGLTRRAVPGGASLLAFGAAGLTVAAAMGAAAFAINQARAAMRFADDLDDAADKINIGVEALQEWRFAAMEAGGAAEDADKAIDGFQKKLGEGLAGGRSIKWFERLGFGRDDLKAFKSTEEAMDAVIDRIAALSTEAERAAVAEKLGLGPLTSLIRRGGDEIEAMRQKARDLGVVMDEAMVRKGADASREMERLSQVIDMELKRSFIELSDEVVSFTTYLADALSGLNNFIARASQWRDQVEALYPGLQRNMAEGDPLGALWGAGRSVFSGRTADVAGAIQRGESLVSTRMPTAAQLAALVADPPRRPDASLIDLPTAPRGGRGGRSTAERDAERLARERERLLESLAREEGQARKRLLREQHAGDTAEDRAALAQAMLELERAERDEKRKVLRAELERTGALDEVTRLQLDELDGMDRQADLLTERQILEEKRRDLAAEALRIDQARESDALALLDIEAQLAGTYKERLEIERRILILQQAAERRALEAAIDADGVRTPEELVQLRRQGWIHQGRLDVFDHNAREEMRSQFHSYGREVVRAIEDGRIGQHIADELKSRLIDMALDGLFNFMNPQGGGAGAGGGGGFWSSAASFLGSMFGGGGTGPGRAGGGELWRGVRHPVAETGRPELMLIGGKGQVTGAAETAALLKEAMGEGGANGGRTIQHIHNYDLRGAVVQEDLMRQMEAKADAAAAAAEANAVGRALDMAQRGAPQRQHAYRLLGT